MPFGIDGAAANTAVLSCRLVDRRPTATSCTHTMHDLSATSVACGSLHGERQCTPTRVAPVNRFHNFEQMHPVPLLIRARSAHDGSCAYTSLCRMWTTAQANVSAARRPC